MKSLITKIILAQTLMLVSLGASAGFMIEPYLNQSLSGEATDNTSNNNIDSDATKMTYGAKVGYMSPMGLMLGVDLQLGGGDWEQDSLTRDTSVQDLGAFVGYQSYTGFRASLGYMFQADLTLDLANNPDIDYSGSGFKLGLGYSFMSMGAEWFAVNLEYHMMTYDEFEQGTSSGSLTNEVETNAILVGVSFPIDLDTI